MPHSPPRWRATARFRYLYARQGRGTRARGRGARASSASARGCGRRAELLDEGLLGDGPSGSIPGRIGDVVLAARDAVAFVDPSMPKEAELRSGHGSLMPDEMLVPLVAAAGRASG